MKTTITYRRTVCKQCGRIVYAPCKEEIPVKLLCTTCFEGSTENLGFNRTEYMDFADYNRQITEFIYQKVGMFEHLTRDEIKELAVAMLLSDDIAVRATYMLVTKMQEMNPQYTQLLKMIDDLLDGEEA